MLLLIQRWPLEPTLDGRQSSPHGVGHGGAADRVATLSCNFQAVEVEPVCDWRAQGLHNCDDTWDIHVADSRDDGTEPPAASHLTAGPKRHRKDSGSLSRAGELRAGASELRKRKIFDQC